MWQLLVNGSKSSGRGGWIPLSVSAQTYYPRLLSGVAGRQKGIRGLDNVVLGELLMFDAHVTHLCHEDIP